MKKSTAIEEEMLMVPGGDEKKKVFFNSVISSAFEKNALFIPLKNKKNVTDLIS